MQDPNVIQQSLQSDFFEHIPVEIQEHILFLTKNIGFSVLLSLTNQHWHKQALRRIKRLRLDPLEAHRLRDASFNFSQVKSLEIVSQGLNIDWAIKQFPVRDETEFTSKWDSNTLKSLQLWFPQFGEALTSVEIKGPNMSSPISETLLETLAQSKASRTLLSLKLWNVRPSAFDTKKFPSVATFSAELVSTPQHELIQTLHHMAENYPSLRDLTLSWLSSLQFGALESHEPDLFASLAHFAALETFNVSSPTFCGLRFNMKDENILDTARKVKQFCPERVQINFFNYSQSYFLGTLPEYLWYSQASTKLIESVESLLPPKRGANRSPYGLVLGVSESSSSYRHFDCEKLTELVRLWSRLPQAAPLSTVDPRIGCSLLQASLAKIPVQFVQLVAEETEKALAELNSYEGSSKIWTDMSSEEKSNDCLLSCATMRAGGENLSKVIGYLASDRFPARTRALVASHTPPGTTSPMRACLEHIYDADAFYVMLKAGVYPEPLIDDLLVSYHRTILQSDKNLEIIHLLDDLITPYANQQRLNEALRSFLNTTEARTVANVDEIFRQLCDRGADVTTCREHIGPIATGIIRLEEAEFKRIMDLCAPHDEETLVDFFLDAAARNGDSLPSYHFQLLREFGANTTKALLRLLEPQYGYQNAERLSRVCELLLLHGANPCVLNSDGQSSLDMVSLFIEYYSEEFDCEAVENVFKSQGFQIPSLPAEEVQRFSDIIEEIKQEYYGGYML